MKLAGFFGFDVENLIEKIDISATIANEECGSELKKWVGTFLKDNIVDIAALVGCFATGGVGLLTTGGKAMGIITKVLGYGADAYALKQKYDELSSMSKYQNAPSALLWEMTKEVATLGGAKLLEHYGYKKGAELTSELLNKIKIPLSVSGAENAIGGGKLVYKGYNQQ